MDKVSGMTIVKPFVDGIQTGVGTVGIDLREKKRILIGPRIRFVKSEDFGMISMGPNGSIDIETGLPPVWAKE